MGTMKGLLWTSTRSDQKLNALAPEGGASEAATFVTIQSLTTFPVASGVVVIAWNVAGTLGEWGASRWMPFIGALLIGGFLTVWSITDPDSNMSGRDKFGAVVIGLINILFLYASVIGIDTAVSTGTAGS